MARRVLASIRPWSAMLALIALFVGNSLLQACQTAPPTAGSLNAATLAPPTTLPVMPAASPSPTAPRPTATARAATQSETPTRLWIADGGDANIVAVDPRTGKVLDRIYRGFGAPLTSADGRWQFWTRESIRKTQSQIEVNWLDLRSGGKPRKLLLPGLAPAGSGAPDDSTQASLALSPDNRLLLVTEAGKTATRWIARLHVVELGAGVARPPIEVFSDDAPGGTHFLQSFAAPDGRWLFVALNSTPSSPTRQGGPQPTWRTRLAVVDVARRAVERVVDAPETIQADGLWLDGALSRDGTRLYLIQMIVRNSEQAGHRFIAMDPGTGTISLNRLVEQAQGGERFCVPYPLRFTPDGRYLYAYCGREPRRPQGYFQFLDTQTGLVAEKVVVASQDQQSDLGDGIRFQMVASPDNTLVYIANTQTREVSVLDLRQRAIVRTATLQKPQPAAFDPWRRLRDWLATPASAKISARPGAALSPDGRRLYFVETVDFENGNGVWGVDTASLRPLGHWLLGKSIAGLQVSADGRELYAVSQQQNALYVLDAASGRELRTVEHVGATGGASGFALAPPQVFP